jgi:hypothetical protein
MPRSISPTFLAQLSASQCSPALFAVLAFANETLYLWSGLGPLTPAGPPFNALSTFPYGQTWTGLGWLAKISAIPQTTKIQAQSVTFSLSGIPSELVSDAVGQVRMTGTGTVFLGFFDSSGALIGDPIQLFAGALDVPTLDDSGETSIISITAENPLLTLNEAPNRQFDDLDQQIYVPGDLGFSFVDALANLQLLWPSPNSWGTPYPINIVMTPNGADVAVGGTVTIQTRVNYNNGSFYEKPSGSGSGPVWLGDICSSNPEIATVTPLSGIVTGRSPGTCSIVVRAPTFSGGGGPNGEMRAACTLIVRS